MANETRTVQVFPSGHLYRVQGEYPHLQIAENRSDEFRPATDDEAKAIQAQELAQVYAERDVLCCDSHLIDSLAHLDSSGVFPGDVMSGAWSFEQWENLCANPDDWTLEQCRDYLRDYGAGDTMDPDPWTMDRMSLVELLESIDIECRDDEDDETLRVAVISNIDDGTLEGLDDWQEACRELAQDNPAEVYEWWRVTEWLCGALRESGEVVIDNDFGCWWGRTCTGQGYLMDGTLQAIARRYLDR